MAHCPYYSQRYARHLAIDEGSLTRRQDSRWQAALQLDGKRRTVYGRTRAEVAAKLAELRRQSAACGAIPDPGKRTLGDVLDAWIEARSPRWKPTPLLDYRQTCDLRLRPALGAVRLLKLSPDRIERFLARYHGQPRTALKCFRVLVQALALAARCNVSRANGCDGAQGASRRTHHHPASRSY